MDQSRPTKKWAFDRSRLVVVDGDYRQEYQVRAAPGDAFGTRMELLSDAAGAFLDAGANVLVTPTDQDVSVGRSGAAATDVVVFSHQCAAAFRACIDRHPRGSAATLVGALGPAVELLTLDEIDEAALQSTYRARAEALIRAHVDAVICRAFTELPALLVAIRAVKEVNADVPVIATMCFDCGPNQTDTAMGVSVPQACEALAGLGLVAIGSEGGRSPDTAPAVTTKLAELTDLPLWATVSPGHPLLEDGRIVYSDGPKEFAERCKALAMAGATFVGGSAGTTVEHAAAWASSISSDKRLKKRA
ncbi:Bifunctional homocysteine S-methyltransferase/5,10-methylenetetrahydrofolate reductase [Phycisphaerae bacterium RAS2]|nr:Bifunctional homocysteine S-methyltransferase/5,10-methylenetetrahydrofolate reductase [Phycisphaerae bacterium RAS2]